MAATPSTAATASRTTATQRPHVMPATVNAVHDAASLVAAAAAAATGVAALQTPATAAATAAAAVGAVATVGYA